LKSLLNLKLHWQILIAMVLAVIAGRLSGVDGELLGFRFYDAYVFLGTIFINALKMIIVPLIVSSIIVGVSGVGQGEDLGRLGLKTLSFYALSSLLAIIIGLAVVNIIEPGLDNGMPVGEALALSDETDGMLEKVEGRGLSDVAEIFIRMVPTNIVAAAAQGQMLGLIVFSLLFGFFMTRAAKQNSEALIKLATGVYETMMVITMFIMRFAPIGVFALIAKTVATTGFDAFVPLAWFFVSVVLALSIHVFIAYPVLLSLSGVSPKKHFQAMLPAMLTAFSTASSSATLPLTLECVEKNAGVSKRTSSFVLPLGATVNMDGTALYECVAAMFLVQAYGNDLGLGTQFTVVLLALLTSIGVAGIPAASLVAITIILTAVGVPVEAIGLILVTDRILDMCRTSVNIFGDSCAAVVIARSEGEATLVALKN
jgi:Na+/H+-dicarboxylate symporter